MEILQRGRRMKIKKEKIDKKANFTHFMTIVISFLKQNKNMYQAIGETKQYIAANMQEQVDIFLEQQARDSTLQPYLQFGHYFEDDQITKICILLYQYSQSGHYIEAIQRFLPLLDQLQQTILEAHLKQEEAKLNAYFLIPIVSVIVLTIYFALGLLSILVVTTGGT